MLFNRPQAIDYIRQCGLDVLIATSPVNITHFSDHECWLNPLRVDSAKQGAQWLMAGTGYTLMLSAADRIANDIRARTQSLVRH